MVPRPSQRSGPRPAGHVRLSCMTARSQAGRYCDGTNRTQRQDSSPVSEPDDQRRPLVGDDTFDTLFPRDRGSRSRDRQPDPDETHATPPRTAAVPKRHRESAVIPPVGSPPPPRSAATVLPWLIIGASLLSLAVVGFLILRGKTSTSSPVPTPTATATAPGSTTSSTSTVVLPPPATVPPPGFEKCSGTDIGYKVATNGHYVPVRGRCRSPGDDEGGVFDGWQFQPSGLQCRHRKDLHTELLGPGLYPVHDPANGQEVGPDIHLRGA